MERGGSIQSFARDNLATDRALEDKEDDSDQVVINPEGIIYKSMKKDHPNEVRTADYATEHIPDFKNSVIND